MAGLKELRDGIVEARADLHAAFHEAHGQWDSKPGASESEDAWSPRQVAEHAIGTDLLLASTMSRALGRDQAPAADPSCPTPASASAELTRFAAQSDRILDGFGEPELAKTYRGRSSTRSVAQGLQLMASHLHEHAGQIREALR